MFLQKVGLLALAASTMASPMPSGNKNVDDTSTRSDWVSSYKDVDDTSTRSDWVSSYKNVDDTSTRSDWVSSYKNVDDTSTRSDWVSSYKNVDDTSTRSDWVSSYKNTPGDKIVVDMMPQHWVPLGPDYLKLDYSPIHHEHLITLASGTMMMHGDGLAGFVRDVARLLHI